jgi:hypothetical protein
MIERKCPHCGAPIVFKTSICLLAVCAHCSSLVRRKDLDVEKLGEVAQLQPDGTPLQLGGRGAHQGAAFDIVGRVQLATDAGFWNEWNIVFADGKQGWLGEAQGVYAVSFAAAAPDNVPLFKNITVGQKIDLGGTTFRARDLLTARYLSAEGELPFRPPLGEAAPSVDLVAPGRKFATLDWSEGAEKPSLFLGEYEEFDDLKLTGLREFAGWKRPA